MRTLLPVLLFLCTCFSLQAQLQLTIEEDYFAGPFNRDANYTGGFHVAFPLLKEHKDAEGTITCIEHIAFTPLAKRAYVAFAVLGTDYNSLEPKTNIQLGSVGFTPENIGANVPIRYDRPYSSSLFLGSSTLFEKNKHVSFLSEYRIDYFGLRIMDALQTQIHLAMDTSDGRPVPAGWDYQIADQYSSTPRWPISLNARGTRAYLSPSWNRWFRAYTKLGYSLGTQTYAQAALGTRLGLSDQSIFLFDNTPITKDQSFAEKHNATSRSFLTFATVELSANAWAHNAFLQGIPFLPEDQRGEHYFTCDQIQPLTWQAELGLHAIYKNYYFNYKMTYRSLEYQSQTSAPQDFVPQGHVWAAVTLGKWVGME